MYLLDAATDLQAIAAWGSLVVAIATFVISLITKAQSKKIKELSDIVTKLEKANELMMQTNQLTMERMSIEKIANLRNSVPVFQIASITEYDEPTRVEIVLHNVGVEIQYVNTNNQTPNIITFDNQDTEKNRYPKIRAFFKQGHTIDDYEFDIVSKSITGHEHKQRFVKKKGSRADITPPEY